MTEREIVGYLKGNKNKGVSFMLMPEEVKQWCIRHRDERIFSRYNTIWINHVYLDSSDSRYTYCLPEDYELV